MASSVSAERVLTDLRPSLIRIAYRMLGSVAEAKDCGRELAEAFYVASRIGDIVALRGVLCDDVVAVAVAVAVADGGGKFSSSPAPLVGLETVLARHAEMAHGFAAQPSQLIRYVMIDGLPGFVTIEAGGIVQTTALHMEGRLIAAIYVTRNPDKLRHLPEAHIQ